MYLRLFTALLCGMTLYSDAQSTAPDEASRASFSVRDSIEMRTFSDPFTRTPGATAKEAPDGRGFVVITTQGHIASNTLESCLWYFSRSDVEAFLKRKRANPPAPQLLFRKVGKPKAEQWGSYGSLITKVLWTPDSKSLLLLVEEPSGNHRLYRVWLSSRASQDMTPHEVGDVSAPTLRAGVFAYLVSLPRSHEERKDNVSTVLTGTSMFNLLEPDVNADPPYIGARWRLKVQFEGKTNTFPNSPSRFFPFGAVGSFEPLIAPDGRSILTATPVPDVPQSWTAYWSEFITRRFIPATNLSDRSGRHFLWPWQYSIIDLKSGKSTPLFNAPTGFTMSAGDVYEAKWSPMGDKIVATYTYLPLDRADHSPDDSVKPCAIVEYVTRTHTATCIAAMARPDQDEHVMSVDYDSSGNLMAHLLIRGERVIRIYDHESRRWSQEAEAPRPDRLSLYIQQDMDVPPTLWAREGQERRLLWDANPQLKQFHFGHASLFHWADSSGYTWRGGLILPVGPIPLHGYPLVIQTHGFYNEHEFLVDGAYTTSSAAQPLACSGIAVLQMEDRPDRHSRPAAQEADDEVRGIESAIDHLAEEQLIDSSRVGIEGFSRTSWYVEAALEHEPSRYKAAILSDGVDMSYVQDVLFAPGSDELKTEMEGPYGAPPFGKGLETWMKKSVGFNLDKITAPVRLEAHDIVSVVGEWETYSILHQQGKPVDLIQIPNGQHILQKPKERFVSQQGAVDWFRFWLQGYERLDVEDKNQYQRWERMREASK